MGKTRCPTVRGYYRRRHRATEGVSTEEKMFQSATLSSHVLTHFTERHVDGALAGTTGEFRLLELTGLVDANGVLAGGVRIDTPAGTVVADGSPDYIITAAGKSPILAGRQRLHPPSHTMPQVVYLGDQTGELELLDALEAGTIDAVARGEIGNRDAAYARGDAFVVTALDEKVEHGGFALAAEDSELASCLDRMIDWLTDDRRIDYADWREDPAAFMRRTAMWNEGRGAPCQLCSCVLA